jgi:hypothetical protein
MRVFFYFKFLTVQINIIYYFIAHFDDFIFFYIRFIEYILKYILNFSKGYIIFFWNMNIHPSLISIQPKAPYRVI